jgi:hypothetical protein
MFNTKKTLGFEPQNTHTIMNENENVYSIMHYRKKMHNSLSHMLYHKLIENYLHTNTKKTAE